MQLLRRISGKYQRFVAGSFHKREFAIESSVPIISFTFDDFPRSALWTGGEILRSMGVCGTYYASLGLAGKQSETGMMFQLEDLGIALEQGHELGCHTFSHSHSWKVAPRSFELEIIKNREALQGVIPGASFRTLSFPIGNPRADTKRRASKYFSCCRGGGQTFNVGTVDSNLLSAFFLEQSRHSPDAVKRIIDRNSEASGWLIFATHDVCATPTQWGCVPQFFEEVVRYAVRSGALILPVIRAYESLSRMVQPLGSEDEVPLEDEAPLYEEDGVESSKRHAGRSHSQ